jgi:hypothetical protein
VCCLFMSNDIQTYVPPKWIGSEIYSIKSLLIEEERGSAFTSGEKEHWLIHGSLE